MLIAMTCSQGCIATAAAVAQAAGQLGTMYLTMKKEPIQIRTPECGNIDPIYPSDGYQDRLTEAEKDQIAAQAIRLQELCPN